MAGAGAAPQARERWARRTPVPSTADPARLDAALANLELTVRRRLDGLLQGNHLGLVPGPGTEPGEARPYDPGDDVRRMDWAVTARTTVPHIRQTVADRELETWLVVDLSASLDFGTAECEKRDLVVAAAAAVAHLTQGGGNRIGAVIATGAPQPGHDESAPPSGRGVTGEPRAASGSGRAVGQGLIRVPARGGRPAIQHLLRTIAGTPRSEPGRRGDLALALEQLRRPPRRRGLAVVISDFVGPLNWERSLRALSARHDLLAVEITDPRDLSLPAVGLVTLTDPESGRSKQVDTTAELRADFARAAAEHREEVAAALRRAGAARLALSTDRDWVADMLRFVMGRKRGWSGAAPPGGPAGYARESV
jgi:uncharacterized protein (DUF58 family)